MDESRTGSSQTRVWFDRPLDISVSIAFNPYVSVFALLCDAVGELGGNAPRSRSAKAVWSLLGPACRAAAPVVARGYSLSPDFLSPRDPCRDTKLSDELERLRSLGAGEIREDIELTFADSLLPEHWARVWHQPRGWVHEFATAVEHLGAAVEPTWRRSLHHREREVDRFGRAALRGAADVALASAHPRGVLRGTVLEFPDDDPVDIDATGKRIALTPMVGRPRSAPSNFDRPGVVWFGYPLSIPARESEGARAQADELSALLTPIRAQLLQHLDSAHTMGAVTRLLSCSAATATYHCDQLAKAGLLERRRAGNSTVVARTARGERLLELYSP